jgi:hypothetical protein
VFGTEAVFTECYSAIMGFVQIGAAKVIPYLRAQKYFPQYFLYFLSALDRI